MIAIRGATTVFHNDKDEILKETTILLAQILKVNDISKDQIVSIIFTATKDITKVYPAVAARTLGITEAGLICMQEMFVEGSLEKCIRVMVQVCGSDKKQTQAQHVYLNGATVLRPDLKQS